MLGYCLNDHTFVMMFILLSYGFQDSAKTKSCALEEQAMFLILLSVLFGVLGFKRIICYVALY